ncbi:WGR domain-containing protein [Amycolatopsis sp. cmx-4-61]|uniref:WGR domain-containing protein n=1 Tax=Amycolatopsis sp. cmx-4-61 TaxID=2790937 RepID=UPI00397D2A98
MSTSTIKVHAWELHKTGDGSDKYYRILLLNHVLLVNYGRRNTRGQFYAHVKSTADAAQQVARDLTNEKNDKGYSLTRDMTDFEVPTELARNLTDLSQGKHVGNVAPAFCNHLVEIFKQTADQQATVTGEASR